MNKGTKMEEGLIKGIPGNFLLFFISLLFFFFEIGSHYVAQAGLELITFLSQPLEC
jgi:hypothetical protein